MHKKLKKKKVEIYQKALEKIFKTFNIFNDNAGIL